MNVVKTCMQQQASTRICWLAVWSSHGKNEMKKKSTLFVETCSFFFFATTIQDVIWTIISMSMPMVGNKHFQFPTNRSCYLYNTTIVLIYYYIIIICYFVIGLFGLCPCPGLCFVFELSNFHNGLRASHCVDRSFQNDISVDVVPEST